MPRQALPPLDAGAQGGGMTGATMVEARRASQMDRRFTEVEFGGQKVEVPAGEYYDRFRMNPDLDEVARDPAAGNIDFFRRIPEQLVTTRVGPTWAPNFYYRSSVQLLFLAPIARLRAMSPMPLEPLKASPGRGLAALTFFSYAVCDNDPYNEVSIAIVVRRPGARGSRTLELLGNIRRRCFFAHVLALPADTEIARVRSVYGYQLPKWLAEIEMNIGADVTASIAASGVTQCRVPVSHGDKHHNQPDRWRVASDLGSVEHALVRATSLSSRREAVTQRRADEPVARRAGRTHRRGLRRGQGRAACSEHATAAENIRSSSAVKVNRTEREDEATTFVTPGNSTKCSREIQSNDS